MPASLAKRLADHGLGHLTLRDLAKIEECFGVDLVHVTEGPKAPAPLPPSDPAHPASAPLATDSTYAIAA